MEKDNNSEYESSEGEEAKYSSSSSSSEEELEERENSKRRKKNSEKDNGNKRNVNKGGDNSTKKDNDSVSRKRSYEKDDDETEEEEEERYRAKRAAKSSKDVLFRVIVPANEIGKVIGRQGSRIKQLREDTGARIKIADPITPLEERVIIISSKAEEDEEKSAAEHALIQIVNVILERNEGITATKSGSRHVGPNMIRLLVANSQAGSLIGISGNTIKETRKESGASVQIMARNHLPLCASASETDRLVQISGEISQVLKALEHIGATLRENPAKEVVSTRPAYFLAPGATNRLMLLPQSVLSAYGSPYGNFNSPHAKGGRKFSGESSGPRVTKEITIPSHVVGALIGKGGSNIQQIRSRSGATVKIAEEKDVGTRSVYIEGTTHQVDIAQNLVDSFLDEES